MGQRRTEVAEHARTVRRGIGRRPTPPGPRKPAPAPPEKAAAAAGPAVLATLAWINAIDAQLDVLTELFGPPPVAPEPDSATSAAR